MCLSVKIYKEAVPGSFLGKKCVRRVVLIVIYALLRVISLGFCPAYMVFFLHILCFGVQLISSIAMMTQKKLSFNCKIS